MRHLPVELVGTRTYALCLGRALGDLPDIELCLLVRSPRQARGLKGRVVVETEFADDVEVIHKPAQVTDPAELALLFGSSAHVIITYQDLIGYRIPLAFPSDETFEQYRATSNLALQAAQRVVAISRSAAGEITAEFGIPSDEIAVVYHGVESTWFAHRSESDSLIRDRLTLPDRYFFSLATDFPHKNLRNLLEAYALLRSRWRDGPLPELVLAGHTSAARAGLYRALDVGPCREGVTFLGPVQPDELRVLYQNALAFVFPSLYEGFGLTPLESMAAGTPVIAMPISAVPEVAGDCVLYPTDLSVRSLTLAMERMAVDRDLREGLRLLAWSTWIRSAGKTPRGRPWRSIARPCSILASGRCELAATCAMRFCTGRAPTRVSHPRRGPTSCPRRSTSDRSGSRTHSRPSIARFPPGSSVRSTGSHSPRAPRPPRTRQRHRGMPRCSPRRRQRDAKEGGLMDRKADVVIPDGHDPADVLRCVRAVLEHSGRALHRAIVIDGSPRDSAACAAFDLLTNFGSQVEVLRISGNLGYAASCNRGLHASENDAVLLGSSSIVGPGWLHELADVASADERTACVAPVFDLWPVYEAITADRGTQSIALEPSAIEAALSGLPRASTVPSVGGSCVYLRREKLDAVGLLDPSINSRSVAINDWLSRAQELGFVAKRANHVYVGHVGVLEDADSTATAPGGRGSARAIDTAGSPEGLPSPCVENSEPLRRQTERFRHTLDGRLPAHAVRPEATGRLRVALDLRALPREQVGTRTYAVSLARALAEMPEIELTLLVRDPVQAAGLSGRIVTAQKWRDDVELIHRPAQVLDSGDLDLLFRSAAHVVLTYQDLIGYRTPLAAPSDAWFERYQATSSLTLRAVQRILVYSENTANEIAAEFGIPRDEIAVVPLGVDAGSFAHSNPADPEVYHKLKLPPRFFFSLAADFPHKNLENLLEAYAILRNRWQDGEAPELVLAGYTSSARAGIYPDLAPRSKKEGLRFLGPVSSDHLRVLYQNALGFVFPSLYEGFGLPPLESMAAGTPVIAVPISAVPEVVGDCALYTDGLSAASLARAMETLVRDHALRDGLRSRGRMYVANFRWEKTARATFEVYRSAVLRPSDRSLRSRRLLREAILKWAEPGPIGQAGDFGPTGIRDAWRMLDGALQARLRRELRRFRPARLRLVRQEQLTEAGRDAPTGALKR